jgi:hypothetical protein
MIEAHLTYYYPTDQPTNPQTLASASTHSSATAISVTTAATWMHPEAVRQQAGALMSAVRPVLLAGLPQLATRDLAALMYCGARTQPWGMSAGLSQAIAQVRFQLCNHKHVCHCQTRLSAFVALMVFLLQPHCALRNPYVPSAAVHTWLAEFDASSFKASSTR